MPCENVKECSCPDTSCPRHSKCCECAVKHRTTDSLPYCFFPDNGGDKSVKNYFKKLSERFST